MSANSDSTNGKGSQDSIIEQIAIYFFGEPNWKLSSKTELRFGTHGSKCVDIKNNRWFDHEANEGGGYIDLIKRELGTTKDSDCYVWMQKEGFRVNEHTQRIIAATYDYIDESGKLIKQVVRYSDPKEFKQRKPDDHGGWTWKVKDTRIVPYHLPELINGIGNNSIIYIPEGEKDVDNLRKWGLVATCNSGGAGKFFPQYVEYFKGANVVVIADNDPQATNKDGKLLFHSDGSPRFPGLDHAQDVAAKLSKVAHRVRVLDLGKVWPECPLKGDISDWIAKGGTVEGLNELVEQLPDYAKPNAPPVADIELRLEYEEVVPRRWYASLNGSGFASIKAEELATQYRFRVWCWDNGHDPPLSTTNAAFELMMKDVRGLAKKRETLVGVDQDEVIASYIMTTIKNEIVWDLQALERYVGSALEISRSRLSCRVHEIDGKKFAVIKFKKLMYTLPVNVAFKLKALDIKVGDISCYLDSIPGSVKYSRKHTINWLRSCYALPLQYVMDYELPVGEGVWEEKERKFEKYT
jgi:hypothetical protein